MKKIKNIHNSNNFNELMFFLEKQNYIKNMVLFEYLKLKPKVKDNISIEKNDNFVIDKDNNFDYYSFYLNLKKMFKCNQNGFIIVFKKNIQYSINIKNNKWNIKK